MSENVTCVTCPTCCLVYSIPDAVYTLARNDKRTIYCPSGHGWSYTISKVDQLTQQLNAANECKNNEAAKADRYRRENFRMARRIAALQGVITRMRNKATATVAT